MPANALKRGLIAPLAGKATIRSEQGEIACRLLATVRLSRFAKVWTIFALVVYVLVGVAPLWVPALDRGGIEVCTANGFRFIANDFVDRKTPPSDRKRALSCPLCALQSAVLIAPADYIVTGAGFDSETAALSPSKGAIAGLFTGFDHFSRAPPLLS